MTIQDWGAVGELLGSIAVLATLIYLSIQVVQTKSATMAATAQANRNEYRDLFQSTRDSPYIPAIIIKAQGEEKLTTEEEYRLLHHIALCTPVFCSANSAHSTWLQTWISSCARY